MRKRVIRRETYILDDASPVSVCLSPQPRASNKAQRMIEGRTATVWRICPETMANVENREDELLKDRVIREVKRHFKVDLKSGQLSYASSKKVENARQPSQGWQ
jgi:hypothetical protein